MIHLLLLLLLQYTFSTETVVTREMLEECDLTLESHTAILDKSCENITVKDCVEYVSADEEVRKSLFSTRNNCFNSVTEENIKEMTVPEALYISNIVRSFPNYGDLSQNILSVWNWKNMEIDFFKSELTFLMHPKFSSIIVSIKDRLPEILTEQNYKSVIPSHCHLLDSAAYRLKESFVSAITWPCFKQMTLSSFGFNVQFLSKSICKQLKPNDLKLLKPKYFAAFTGDQMNQILSFDRNCSVVRDAMDFVFKAEPIEIYYRVCFEKYGDSFVHSKEEL